MSAKAISEATGKDILNRFLNDNGAGVQTCRFATVNMKTDWSQLAAQQPWLLNTVSFCNKLFMLFFKKIRIELDTWFSFTILLFHFVLLIGFGVNDINRPMYKKNVNCDVNKIY